LCLLSNAVKYSDGGTVNLTIELIDEKGDEDPDTGMLTDRVEYSRRISSIQPVSPRTSGPSVRVSIEDTGIGLTKETRDTLFQPFKQAQRMAGGTGLGLFSLSKRMEALGNQNDYKLRKISLFL
jgi:signal transduction histidine kinase